MNGARVKQALTNISYSTILQILIKLLQEWSFDGTLWKKKKLNSFLLFKLIGISKKRYLLNCWEILIKFYRYLPLVIKMYCTKFDKNHYLYNLLKRWLLACDIPSLTAWLNFMKLDRDKLMMKTCPCKLYNIHMWEIKGHHGPLVSWTISVQNQILNRFISFH
jgi:hypothetical protein